MLHIFMNRLARLLAVIGGLVLTALVLLTCVSVLGRGLNTLGHSTLLNAISPDIAAALIATGGKPLTGDFELVEAGISFAIFAFLPICQLRGAHASVDIFANNFPHRLNRFLVVFWEIVMSIIIVLITWRLFVGMQDKMRYGDTTFLLQFPIWWAYAASLAAASIAALVAVYRAIMHLNEFITGRDYPRFMDEEVQ
jgi:TRAP-type C4-dicarboxylate transport system permease small subunit